MRLKITEEQFENHLLGILADLGYIYENGYEIAPDAERAERKDYREVVLFERLRERLTALNPNIPAAAIEDAIGQITRPNFPLLIQNNREFHRLLRDGVKVQFQEDGETKADFVRIIDFESPDNNEFLAVNQFSIKGAKSTKRPDIIIFINGLPLAVLELKNPADINTTIYDPYKQLQTYKEKISDLFIFNELLVIADLREGSLTADYERFGQWRTIDGSTCSFRVFQHPRPTPPDSSPTSKTNPRTPATRRSSAAAPPSPASRPRKASRGRCAMAAAR